MASVDWISASTFEPDETLWRPSPGIVVGGTPTRVLRLHPRGDQVVEQILTTRRLVKPDAAAALLVDRMVRAGMLHPRVPTGHAAGLSVSVVVPVHDQAAHVAEAVIAGLSIGPVTVVDDASTDDSAEQAWRAGALVIRRTTNGGPAAARNTGVEETTGDVIVFVDADCVPLPGTLEAVVALFADPSLGAAAPRIRGCDRTSSTLLRFEDARSPIDMGPRSGPVRPDSRVSFVPTAVLAVRREALSGVGGFDESLRFGEDVDLAWRLGEAGWEVRYVADVEAEHHHRSRPGEIARRRWVYGTAAGPLARRHPKALAAVRASPWTLAAWTALALGRPVAASSLVGWSWLGLRRALLAVPGRDRLSLTLVGSGFTKAFAPLSAAATRQWAPLTLLACFRSKRMRRLLLGSIVVAKAWEWIERRPDLDPITYAALAVADDLIFCGGTWEGCLRARTLLPLLPRTGRPRVGNPAPVKP